MNLETLHSPELGLLFEALAKAQGKIVNALKDKKNPFFKSSYADLASIWDACREPLSNNGLAVVQTIEGSKEDIILNTWIGHSSGQWMKSKMPLTVIPEQRKDKNGNVIASVVTPQAIGSSITYARRYALSALVGICADQDDDGEKAMGRKSNPEPPKEEEISPESILDLLSKFGDKKESMKKYFSAISKADGWNNTRTYNMFIKSTEEDMLKKLETWEKLQAK